jgi:hypothetical protein
LRVRPERTFLANHAVTARDGNLKCLQQARQAKVISNGRPATQGFLATIRENGSLEDVVQRQRKCPSSYHSAADERDGIVHAQVPVAGPAVPFPMIAIDDFEPDRVQCRQLPVGLWVRTGIVAEAIDGFQTRIVWYVGEFLAHMGLDAHQQQHIRREVLRSPETGQHQ